MKQKLLSLLLSLSLALSLALPAMAEPWYTAARNYVIQNGIITDTANGFEPDSPATRALVFEAFWNKEGRPSASGSSFIDVPANAWYYNSSVWAKSVGLANGDDRGLYNGEGRLTRAEVATVLRRYMDRTATPSVNFLSVPDYASIPQWAMPGMVFCYESGYMTGDANGNLMPNGVLTRAQLAQFIYNIFGQGDTVQATPGEVTPPAAIGHSDEDQPKDDVVTTDWTDPQTGHNALYYIQQYNACINDRTPGNDAWKARIARRDQIGAEYGEALARATGRKLDSVAARVELANLATKYGLSDDSTGAQTQTPTQTPAATPGTSQNSVQTIAALGGLTATCEQYQGKCVVPVYDTPNNHGNPYDVTWDYGSVYSQFIQSIDNWDKVFDASYYKTQFPMLAYLYHNNDALLLKHFQTVGIHEGRQAIAGFNVKAYMTNCDKSLRDAFGENYECYYLYYLKNYDSQKSVKTTGNYSNQMKVIMTKVQKDELAGVNKYRAEAGVSPLEFNQTTAYFASYRAWCDCVYGWDAHEGFHNLWETGEWNTIKKMIPSYMSMIIENKNTIGTEKGRVFFNNYSGLAAADTYRTSPGHYKNMICKDDKYIGCGNPYQSDKDYNWYGKYGSNTIVVDTMTY